MVEWFTGAIIFLSIVGFVFAGLVYVCLKCWEFTGAVLVLGLFLLFVLFFVPIKAIRSDAVNCNVMKNNRMAVVMCGDLHCSVTDIERYNDIDKRKVKVVEMLNVFNMKMGGKILEVE